MSLDRNLELVWHEAQPPRIDPLEKEKWIEALLSGEYEQCPGALQAEGKYCCLGVKFNLSVIEHPNSYRWRIYNTYDAVDVDGSADNAILPPLYAKELGLARDGVFVRWGVSDSGSEAYMGVETLADLNDNGFTFSQIADVIRYFL